MGICIVSMRGAWARELFTGVIERLGHFAEDVGAAVLRLGEGLLHDLLGDSGDLDVHLQRGDALAVPATLKSMSPR